MFESRGGADDQGKAVSFPSLGGGHGRPGPCPVWGTRRSCKNCSDSVSPAAQMEECTDSMHHRNPGSPGKREGDNSSYVWDGIVSDRKTGGDKFRLITSEGGCEKDFDVGVGAAMKKQRSKSNCTKKTFPKMKGNEVKADDDEDNKNVHAGSQCRRRNGRGWRCSERTLVGYYLCEHHLGKGRLKSINNSAVSVVGNGKGTKFKDLHLIHAATSAL